MPPDATARPAPAARLPRLWDGLVLAALVLILPNLVLLLVDYPTIESHQAPLVKKVRYPNKHNVFRDEGYGRFAVNSLGLLGAEPRPATQPDVYRVALFGDSFVEGYQVTPSQHFGSLLQQGLKAPPGFTSVEVWNYGFSGDNTGNAYARWMHVAPQAAFHQVVFAFNLGDLRENRLEDGKHPLGAFLVRDGRGGYALDVSHVEGKDVPDLELRLRSALGPLFTALYRVKVRLDDEVGRSVDNFGSWLGRGTVLAAPVTPEDLSAPLIADTCGQLLHVERAIEAVGPRAFLLGLPAVDVVDEASSEPQAGREYRALVDCLRASDPSLIDATDALRAELRRGRDPFRDWNDAGGHYNRFGHQAVAAALLEALRGAHAPAPRGGGHAVQ